MQASTVLPHFLYICINQLLLKVLWQKVIAFVKGNLQEILQAGVGRNGTFHCVWLTCSFSAVLTGLLCGEESLLGKFSWSPGGTREALQGVEVGESP